MYLIKDEETYYNINRSSPWMLGSQVINNLFKNSLSFLNFSSQEIFHIMHKHITYILRTVNCSKSVLLLTEIKENFSLFWMFPGVVCVTRYCK